MLMAMTRPIIIFIKSRDDASGNSYCVFSKPFEIVTLFKNQVCMEGVGLLFANSKVGLHYLYFFHPREKELDPPFFTI